MLDKVLYRLSKRGNKWKAIHEEVFDKLKEVERRFYEEREVVEMITPLLEPCQVKIVSRELWRGSFAAIVYEQFRVLAVHNFGPPDGITFDGITFQSKPVAQIDFHIIQDCLKKIASFARRVSEELGKWFGHDYRFAR